MKKIIILCMIFIFLFCLYIYLYHDNKKYEYENLTLIIPRLSFFDKIEKDNDEYKFSFLAYKSKKKIETQLRNITNNYEKYICQNKIYNFDKKNNITIKKYEVNKKGLWSKFNIEIFIGKEDNDYCNIVSEPKMLSYEIKKGYVKPYEYLYLDSNSGIEYMIYYNYTEGDILLKNGKNKMTYLISMLKFNWIKIDDILEWLDYLSSTNQATKTIDINNQYISYEVDNIKFTIDNHSLKKKKLFINNRK